MTEEEEKKDRIEFAMSLDKILAEMVTGLTRVQHVQMQQGLIRHFHEAFGVQAPVDPEPLPSDDA